MKRFYLFLILSLVSYQIEAKTFITVMDGNFDSPNVWDIGEVPSFDGDTIKIYHQIIYDRDSLVFGNKLCKKRPFIYIDYTGTLCLSHPHDFYYLVILQYGMLYGKFTNSYGTEHYIYAGVSHFQNGWTISYDPNWKGITIVKYKGKQIIDTITYDCHKNIIPDTSYYDSKCPKAAYFIEKTNMNDSILKFRLYSNKNLVFNFQFKDTLIQKLEGDSFYYNKKKKDSFTVLVKMNDNCDKFYFKSIFYDFRTPISHASIRILNNDFFELKFIDNQMMNVSTESNEKFEIIIYNALGQKFKSTSFKNSIDIPIEEYLNSIYFVNILNQKKQVILTKKMMF